MSWQLLLSQCVLLPTITALIHNVNSQPWGNSQVAEKACSVEDHSSDRVTRRNKFSGGGREV